MGRALATVLAALCFCAPAAAKTDGPVQLAFVWPAQGTITSPFGNDNGRWHPGLDIGTLDVLTIRAAAPGVVEQVGTPVGYEGYGNVVLIRMAPGFEALYAHLASWRVHVGERVAGNEPLGIAGCTGWCTGTHLHFELRDRGTPIDPRLWLD